jgi:DNA polymerase-3 subunit delta'
VVADAMRSVTHANIPPLADAHAELSRLAAQAPLYNYDAGLLVMEIGSLLAAVATPREAAHG